MNVKPGASILYEMKGPQLVEALEKNIYGDTNWTGHVRLGEGIQFNPSSPDDHLATTFVELLPESRNAAERWILLQFGFNNKNKTTNKCIVSVQDSNLFTLETYNLNEGFENPEDSEQEMNLEIPETVKNIRLTFSSPDGMPVEIPNSIRMYYVPERRSGEAFEMEKPSLQLSRRTTETRFHRSVVSKLRNISLPGIHEEQSRVGNVDRATLKQWANAPDDEKNFAALRYIDGVLSLKRIGGEPGQANGIWDFMLNLYTDKEKELGRVLSLCCGFGHAERALATVRKFRFCDAYDVVPKALEGAREHAKKQGITNINYDIMDLNNVTLHHPYDLVIAGGVHHIKNLERLFSEVSSHLTEDGIFLMYEYIGPAQCQPTQRQVDIINACIRLIPPIYRVKISSQRALGVKNPEEAMRAIRERKLRLIDHLWNSFSPMTCEQWNAHDPSEAVRSNEIIPLLKQYFDKVDVRYSGGSILQFTLHDIAGNFAIDTAETKAILDMIWNIEQVAIKYDDVPEDFAIIVARNM